MELPGWSIPLGSSMACLDCRVVFDAAENACPKCGSEISGFKVENGHGAQLIRDQRNIIDEAEGVLLTLAKRKLGPSSLLAWRMVDRIREHKQARSVPAAVVAQERAS